MKSFRNWRINEGYNYTPSIDGKPFEPQTLQQAETQLQYLSMMVRTAFAHSPKFANIKHEIVRLTSEIDHLASKIGALDLELRNVPWRDENPPAGQQPSS